MPGRADAPDMAAARLAAELVGRRADINRELARNGVRFGVYKNGTYDDRLFPYDPIPRIIGSDEFDRLEAGLKQRVDALNAYLRDIYSDKRIVHDGVVPEDFVYTSAGYYPQVNGVTPPGGIFAHIAGEDLVQGQDGHWWVLEDNLRIPSGASYPLFARDIERRANPRLFRQVHVRDNRDYPRLLRKAMDFVSCEGIAVVMTPGRYNSAFFEHAYLAEKTGAALAFPEDLEVVDNKLFLTDYAGNRHRVGVVYRRLTDEYLDPFSFNPDSVIGVPGLLNAYRAGNVAIVNAPGNGAADDKGIYYFVPRMIEYYLHQKPLLDNAPTYMPMFPDDRREVLDRLGELVIKDVAEAGGYGVVFGRDLDASARRDLADRIKAEPRRFIAQEVIPFRDLDVVDPATGEPTPRKADLRAFVITAQSTHVWYSGLTRYSSVPGQMIVNSSQGGGFKDTWVLAPDAAGSAGAAVAGSAGRGESIDLVSLLPHARGHALALVTASKADNLYWLGRYTERAFTTLTEFFPFYDRVMDTDVDAFRPFARALDLPEDFADFDTFIHTFLYDGDTPDSVRSAIQAAFNNAVILRPELSSRLLQYIELAVSNITSAAQEAAEARDIYRQRDIADDMLAFWGGIENSDVDSTLKAFVFIGKYIERLDLYTRLAMPAERMDAPLNKLATYAGLMDGLPLPQCFADGVGWLLGQLPTRGYDALADRLKDFLDDFGGRATGGRDDAASLSSMNMESHAA
ncbi:circularly permuted type 2 ATP-grasp protein [Bifidobacterium pullorum subsp. saeculare]|uniref:Circularly permuted type 2 ATP-grasp protein n=1 Tax=Bifidobacterium pullorum subsp. saeculare TaxID=78257 RepID=A0A939B9P9_9BIFI|nr:circularly permuted type 2 ATP-grasp protein [Bifidobacterium pullorum]MBM6699753.1 circularly permuted type 2 ATP-grasp protein [Bifidobacterium pullorum subsp. saeculare]